MSRKVEANICESIEKEATIYTLSAVFGDMLKDARLFVGATPQAAMACAPAGWDCAPNARVARAAEIHDEIAMRGLSRNPTNRFPTAMAMAAVIEECASLIGTMDLPIRAVGGQC